MTAPDLETFKRIWEFSKDSPYMAKMDDADITLKGDNISCGDWLEISLKMKGKKIAEARFLHRGCAVSAVATSTLLEYAEGKTLEEVRELTPEKHLKLFGAPISPARLKCAMLALEVVKRGEVVLGKAKVAPKKKKTARRRS